MSIFDEKRKDLSDDLINEAVKKINDNLDVDILYHKNLILNKHYWTIRDCMENYALEFLNATDFNSYHQKINDNLEYIEWYYNAILYIPIIRLDFCNKVEFLSLFNSGMEYFENWNLIKGLFNIINDICKENNLEFIPIDQYKFKLISINLNALVSKINDKKLHNQITKFWLEKELEEKVKILGWISGHIENRIKDQIDYSIFHQDIITKLFKDLNNLYKHFDKKDGIPKHVISYEEYKCLSEKEKLNKANKDMRLIMYILLEYENNPD